MPTAQELIRQARGFQQSGQVQTALEVYRTAVKTHPRSPEAHSALGVILAQLGMDAEAIEHLERVTKLLPTSPDALCNLAQAHRAQGRLERALDCFDRARWMVKNHPRATAGAAEIQVRIGQADKAYETLRPFVAIMQDPAPVALTFARACAHTGRESEGIAALQRHLAGTGERLDQHVRVLMHFELATLSDAAGLHDQAFGAATEANRLLPKRFDAGAHSAAISRIIEQWTPERHASLPKGTDASQAPVFIVGLPRCGAGLVEQVIAGHPACAPGGDLALMRHIIARLQGVQSPEIVLFDRLDALSPSAVVGAASFYLGSLAQIGGAAARITDKLTHNFLYLGLIDRMLPGARIIHVTRDELDVGISCYLRHFDLPYRFTGNLGDIGSYIRDARRLMAHWRSFISVPVLEVSYESLVADVPGQAGRIIDFLGLEWDDRCARTHETKRNPRTLANPAVRRPVTQSRVGLHTRYESYLAPLREALKA